MSKYALRLVAMDGDTPVDVIPYSEVTWANPLNDTATATIKLHALNDPARPGAGKAARDLLDKYDVSVQVFWGNEIDFWREPTNARIVILGDSSDASDVLASADYTGQNVSWDLTGLPIVDRSVLNTKDGRWKFANNSTPGAYILPWLAQGKRFGVAPLVTTQATAQNDSAGNPWRTRVGMTIAPNVTLRQLLESLASQGMIDWRMRGNRLEVYNADTVMRRDLTRQTDTHQSVTLMLGREVTAAPQQRSKTDRVDRVIVQGDDGLWASVARANPLSQRGARAVVQQQGGVTKGSTATMLAESVLARSRVMREQMTREFIITDESEFVPYRDYDVGDVILATGYNGRVEPLRVYQITLQQSATGVVHGNVVLGDRFLEQVVRQTRRMEGIVGGSTIAGGSNAVPTSPPPSPNQPKVPRNFTFNTLPYSPSAANRRGLLLLSWEPPTEDVEDNTDLDLEGYDIRGRRVDLSNAAWQSWGRVAEPLASREGLQVGARYRVEVRAVTRSGGLSDWVGVNLDIEDDDVPPEQPSAPKLSSAFGTVKVAWDKLDSRGESTALDTQYAGVIDDAGKELGRIFIPLTETVLSDMPVGSEVNLRLVAVDTAGNQSTPSTRATVRVKGAMDDPGLVGQLESMDQKITNAAGTVTTYSLNAAPNPAAKGAKTGDVWFRFQSSNQTVIGHWRFDGTSWVAMMTGHQTIASVDLGKATVGQLDGQYIKAGTIAADKLKVGEIGAQLVSTDFLRGKTITGTNITGAMIKTRPEAFRGVEMRGQYNDIVAFDSKGVEKVRIDGSTGDVKFLGNMELGGNVIGAHALKQQIWADAASRQENGMDPWQGWGRYVVVGIPWPQWAQRAVLVASAQWMEHLDEGALTRGLDMWSEGKIATAVGESLPVAPTPASFGRSFLAEAPGSPPNPSFRSLASGTVAFTGVQYNDGKFPDVWASLEMNHNEDVWQRSGFNLHRVNLTAIFMRG